uniref:Uncharacterized protein n=1 Tax=Arion vulgaris TaxID=1028688 RepID=A0A0B7BUK9_9EUPU
MFCLPQIAWHKESSFCIILTSLCSSFFACIAASNTCMILHLEVGFHPGICELLVWLIIHQRNSCHLTALRPFTSISGDSFCYIHNPVFNQKEQR